MRMTFNCPGGIIGAILAAEVRDRRDEMPQDVIERVEADRREWETAGLAPGQQATRLSDGRLVAADSAEAAAEDRAFMARFTPLSQ